jgi:hypothetical protein
MEDERDKKIAEQEKIIKGLLQMGNLQNALITRITDGLRLYMADVIALSVSLGTKPPDPVEMFKGMHIVKDDDDKTN